jgi:DNA mismatch repair protein MutS2
MRLRVTQKTLESLEWPLVAGRLRDHCRTPKARARVPGRPDAGQTLESGPEREGGGDGQTRGESTAAGESTATEEFAESLSDVRERQAETSEARTLLDAGFVPPLGGVADLDVALSRAGKGAGMSPEQLLEVRATLEALRETRRLIAASAASAPRLAALADVLSDHRRLEREIESAITPGGEIRDEASPALADARRETHQLAGDLQRRLSRYLQDPDVAPSLSDDFYTVRNDRYVLPVRADSKGSVRGIVHDASRSGTTLFIEPEAVVELNNRLKQAELTVVRETRRVLEELGRRVAEDAHVLRPDLELLATIDLAFARGRLSQEMRGCEPRVAADGLFRLPQLRHPLLPPDEAVPNDLVLGEKWHVLVISGPNAGGKTIALKSLGLAALMARAGLHVAAEAGARVALVDTVLVDIGDGQDLRESLSTFSAHMVTLAGIVKSASRNSLALLDEVGVGTDPGEGAALAQAVLETLADAGARVLATTHYNLLKEMAAVDARFCNASVDFDPRTLAPTYRLHLGTPGASSATAVAARMGMPSAVLDRANALLDREDRRLDRMLSELSTSRAALEAEQREVAAVRAESESIRDEYRAKLERLQERRDKLFLAMREDLDLAFKDAHAEVARVIRELQRGGSPRVASEARVQLQALEEKTKAAEREAGIDRREERADAFEWRRAKPGDVVGLPGGGTGMLEALPDQKGRVRVRAGNATIVVPADRITRPVGSAGAAKPSGPRVRLEPAAGPGPAGATVGGGTLHCDLRGLRVEEARERIAEALDRALADDRAAVEFVHGVGTGALRRTVREELAASSFVSDLQSGDPERGGDGVTTALLKGR